MVISSAPLLRLVILTGAVAAATAGIAHDKGHKQTSHDHGPVASRAGVPGTEGAPARRVEIVATESDGGMHFTPERLEVRAGEQVEFVIRNAGLIEHEFVIGAEGENAEHARAMFNNPTMPHADENAVRVAPGAAGRLVWRFVEAGQFEFACLIPGHYEAGMKGAAEVR